MLGMKTVKVSVLPPLKYEQAPPRSNVYSPEQYNTTLKANIPGLGYSYHS
jgi:hypothetical protein